MILGSGLIQAAGWQPTWLIRDEFTDTVAAGSVDGTAATPGPGTRAVTDTGSALSVGGGVLEIDSGTGLGGDPSIWHSAVTRASGVAMMLRVRVSATTGNAYWGFDVNQSSFIGENFFHYLSASQTNARVSSAQINIGAYPSTSDRNHAIVLRPAGAFYFIGGNQWDLVWVDNSLSAATVYPGVQNYTVHTTTITFARVAQLPAPFDSDDGLATDTHSGSVAAGTTFTHESDCLIEFTATTLPSADNIDVQLRVQDGSNHWICRINSSGDISLQEVVAGSATQRSNTAGVVSNGHRIVIIADGSTIRLYSNNVLRSTYASATNFTTATAGEVDALGTGGAVSDVKSWPRTLSGTAAAILDKASA